MVKTSQRDILGVAADDLAIICICHSEIDDNATIQCDRCGRWQHMRCVGIDPVMVDLDDLVYHCDHCEPRSLDVDAAKAYIERFQREEMQTVQTKPRRGRGKGSGRRGGGHGASPAMRTDMKRARTTNKQTDSDETDDPSETILTSSGLRDYTFIEHYRYTTAALEALQSHPSEYAQLRDYDQSISTHVKSINNAGGSIRGLFAASDAPANAFVGRYLGEIKSQEEYRNEVNSKFGEVLGPLPNVAFVQSSDLAIDARVFGNESRFMRKSCSPNCSVVPLTIDSRDDQLGLQFSVALRHSIAAGDELTIGFQWSADSPDQIPSLSSNQEALATFARNVLSLIGPCACKREPSECLVTKWLPPAHLSRVRSQTAENEDMGSAHSERQKSGDAMPDQPMTREERKIQMAIARMENADAPKAKRRRRNTGDDSSRPNHNRRASSMRGDDPPTPVESQHRSVSPPVQPKSIRVSRNVKSRAQLIRSPSPDYEVCENLPNKILWLRSFEKERLIKDEQRMKLAEQAKEATARLAEEANRKKMELEAQAREARAAKEREADILRKKAERDAEEARLRAREREIWGDHATSAIPASIPATVMSGDDHRAANVPAHVTPTAPVPIAVNGEHTTDRPQSPKSMGPPSALVRESSRPSPPAAVSKVVRKLSVSEYMRQRKEKAATDATPSPGLESSHEPRESDTDPARTEDDKSDGEIEAGEVEVKAEPLSARRLSPSITPRSEYFQLPPTAPKASGQNHGYNSAQGPKIHPSRAYAVNTSGHVPAASQPNHFQQPYSPRHANFGPDQRQHRQNGFSASYAPYPGQNHVSNVNNEAYQRPHNNIPSGPRLSRPNVPPNGEQIPPYYTNGANSRSDQSGRPPGPPSR